MPTLKEITYNKTDRPKLNCNYAILIDEDWYAGMFYTNAKGKIIFNRNLNNDSGNNTPFGNTPLDWILDPKLAYEHLYTAAPIRIFEIIEE